jgi:hypothetical protein
VSMPALWQTHTEYERYLRYRTASDRPDMMDPLGQIGMAEARCFSCQAGISVLGLIRNEAEALGLLEHQGWTTFERTIKFECEPGQGPDGTTPLIESQTIRVLRCYGCREVDR